MRLLKHITPPMITFMLFVTLALVAMIALVTRPADDPAAKSDLASRINSACKGSSVYDWTTGDEYTPVPAGTVRVTCVRKDQSLYYVAVSR